MKVWMKRAGELYQKFDEKKYYWIVFGILTAVFLFTRLYELGQIPRGIHVDEAGMAFDALGLANYGVDRWLKHLPVYLTNYDSGQSALYAYLAAICIKIFGFSMTVIRLPAVFSGGLVLVFGYLICKEFWGGTKALFAALLVVICPYFIMASRIGLDCNLFLGFFTMAVYLLVLAVKREKLRYYVLAGFSCGLVLYTYAISWMTMPVFLLLFIIYMLRCGKMSWKRLFALGISVFLLAVPLLLFLLVNNGYLDEIVTSFFTIPKLIYYRGAEISPSYLKDNLQMFKNLVTHGPLVYNALPEYGTLYSVSIPFVVLGAVVVLAESVQSFVRKKFSAQTMVFIMGGSVILTNLFVYDARVLNKDNAVFLSLAVLIAAAVFWLQKKIRVAVPVMLLVYAVCGVQFVSYYLTDYPTEVYPQDYIYDDVWPAMDYIEENFTDDEPVYVVMDGVQKPFIYFVLKMQMPPYEYQAAMPTETYGRYHMYYPEELDENGVYIINGNEDKMTQLEENGFTYETVGRFRIYSRQ